jgi:hypothetical protein
LKSLDVDVLASDELVGRLVGLGFPPRAVTALVEHNKDSRAYGGGWPLWDTQRALSATESEWREVACIGPATIRKALRAAERIRDSLN